MRQKPIKSDNRMAWALAVDLDPALIYRSLVGRFCFPGGSANQYPIRLFPTRADAEQALQDCSHKDAKVVRVNVQITAVVPKAAISKATGESKAE